MLKRLIEVALPLKEVSEQSAREKSIRHGHISTLHIWWARRPLAACRAVVFASLIPDPDDAECPEDFRSLIRQVLGRSEFRPRSEEDGRPVEDTPRNRCLEFIKHLVRWENSNAPEYIEPARRLIAAAHKFLHPGAEGDAPKLLDPFAGGGAIPLEALRLGCESHAIDLNPVAHLIELCTLVYPQKYGQPNSRNIPDYIDRPSASTRNKKRATRAAPLFDRVSGNDGSDDLGLIHNAHVIETEYRKNPLAADVKYWGRWILEETQHEIGKYYPEEPSKAVPVAYLWARTITCPNPTCRAMIPLLLQTWLCRKPGLDVALRLRPDGSNKCHFDVVSNKEINFDPNQGTLKRGNLVCPHCQQVATVDYLRNEARSGRMGQQMTAVLSVKAGSFGKQYRCATGEDEAIVRQAAEALEERITSTGFELIPTELIPRSEPRRVTPPLYGLNKFADLFNSRQSLALAVFGAKVHEVVRRLSELQDADYAKAVGTYLALCQSRLADFMSSLCVLNNVGGRGVKNTFGRQALPMVWDYAESSPFNEQGANWNACIEAAAGMIKKNSISSPAHVRRGSATAIAEEDGVFDAVITDPPYYDAVPYSDLSDFFYVWLKRSAGAYYPNEFRTPLTPKQNEIVEQRPHKSLIKRKDAAFYEQMMGKAFGEAYRVLTRDGICLVMFAHKTTAAWEKLISGLIDAKLSVTASWPLRTEKPGRATSLGTAALASSVSLVCRKRPSDTDSGLWDDVRGHLQQVAKERLDFFWAQGIRGADFFISAIGPALSVFGSFERVIKLSGEAVTVGQFLDEVRSIVTNYALTKILKTTHTAAIDAETRFYVVWKWSYGGERVPADEAFKMAKALGMSTNVMWDRTGVLEKSGENVAAVSVEKRKKIRDLGEPNPTGTPASLIDVLHRMCAFREKSDTQGMAQFLNRSGHANNHSLWLIAQAISEILPDGDKEKQLMQGLLNQKEGLVEATRQGELF